MVLWSSIDIWEPGDSKTYFIALNGKLLSLEEFVHVSRGACFSFTVWLYSVNFESGNSKVIIYQLKAQYEVYKTEQ